jgi:hypothetical protein
MATLIYCLCTLTSLACAWLLFKSYRRNRYRLLFWSALCFAGLTFNNLFLILDRVLFPQIDFLLWRLSASLIAMLLLLFGLIWEED